jgi:Rps23 Pro-64 3,4-dihydroxylase Tpa1-like proline 4-hydroxylase
MEIINLRSAFLKEPKKEPFDHYIMDDFISEDLALKLYNQFPDYHSGKWYSYDNPLERKKAIQTWGSFPSETYQFFMALCSQEFVNQLRVLTGCKDLIPDIGLHGAGWHMSTKGDHLNVHQDYSIHPLANMQRKFNIIIYLTPDWKPEWGGNLEFWNHNSETNKANEKVASIDCKFRRAVLFDTTQNSWHGFPDDITCPEGVYRKSIAMYYLVPIAESAKSHKRALYVPRKDQENDKNIQEMIKSRSKI